MAIPGLFHWVRVNLIDTESRHIPRERVAHDKASVDAQLLAESSALILEELSEGLDQFQLR